MSDPRRYWTPHPQATLLAERVRHSDRWRGWAMPAPYLGPGHSPHHR